MIYKLMVRTNRQIAIGPRSVAFTTHARVVVGERAIGITYGYFKPDGDGKRFMPVVNDFINRADTDLVVHDGEAWDINDVNLLVQERVS